MANNKLIPWSEQEDEIVIQSMVGRDSKMSILNSAKIAAQYLEEEGFNRTPQAIAFRWSSVLAKKSLKKVKVDLHLVSLTPPPIPEKQEESELSMFSLDFAINLVSDKMNELRKQNTELARENEELKIKVQHLESTKEKYELLKGFLTQNV